VNDRIRRSFELGTVRIAILPFDDDTGVPGLAGEVASWMRGQISTNMSPRKYPFVKFVPGDAIAASAGSGRMTREEAIHVGRSLGAKRVVWGRLHGLHSDTRTDTWRDRVFKKVSARDSSGTWRTYYDEAFVETVSREREVQVAWEFEVIDTDDEKPLAAREGTEAVTARSIYTAFDPRGDCRDYCLTPPDWKSARADECKDAESRWKRRYGDWSVAGYLEAARGKREFAYSRDDRERFVNAGRPAVCNGLPPAGDLAFLALKDVANPVWDALKGLEASAER
jgi:hypothetical protein